MKRKSMLLSLAVAALASLTACGGGGEEGPQNTIVKFDVLPGAAVTVTAGQSVPLYAASETFGPKIKGMAWSAALASGAASGTLTVEDPTCKQGSFSSREVPGSPHLNVGTGLCETVARVSDDAVGDFVIVGTVTGEDATQRSERVAVHVLPRPRMDFTLEARAVGDLALNVPIHLVADTEFEHELPRTAKVEYEWKLLFGPGTISGTPTSKDTYVILPTPGKYIYLVVAKYTNGTEAVTRSAVASLVVGESEASTALDFQIAAESKQPNVVAGSPSNLVASYTVAPGTGVNKAEYKWTQISGPEATLSSTSGKSIYVVPSDEGTLVFQVEVTITAGAITETKTELVVVTATAAP